MPTTRDVLASLAGLAVVTSCSVGMLFDAPPTKVIGVTPSRVVDSAAAGDAQHSSTLAISTASPDAAPRWTAHRITNAAWLSLADSSGTAPDSLGITLDPAGLSAGIYRDTIAIDPSDPRIAPVRVPVELHIVVPPPPPATNLAFTANPPPILVMNGVFSVEVTARDSGGQTATGFVGRVTVALQGPIAAGGLSGQTSVSAVNGVATFSNLKVTGTCTQCSLVATTPGVASATSSPFNVVLGP